MSRTAVSRVIGVPASRAYAWVADPRTHPRWIPVTRLDALDGADFTMVSGPFARRGAPGFVDRMTTTGGEAPGSSSRADGAGWSAVVKRGPVLLGTAGFEVVPLAVDRCRVVWWEDAYLAGPVPRRVTDPAVSLVLRALVRTSLRRLDRALTAHR
ncbi:polyketide cyclase/dehydrase/lipid transport protein [Sediminihabitans luteus]|uniref:Polyketide cyclase/dehydrase/lipid transport protein n=1 Tax=Sediminihabitans luteus TaxID=1138585 RepID=A0A2M9CE27_9CELL|nr:SRPBCC family protein [Sediminihabitans luteus]PJJ70139.1 polyketide cyclase/dehydrase/lipid transport protein [Sediminihabitans luteus]GIJ00560.1 hypothetical protein Slu03_29370 [Sediminihabitans luteus]